MSPAIVLVPGMSSMGSIVYAPLIEELKRAGFGDVQVVDLPSVDCITTGAQLQPNALEAYIKHIRSVVKLALAESQLDVVVAGHYYGGTPALYVCEGLWKDFQPAGSPRVLRVALISSSLALPGGSIAGDRTEYGNLHGWMNDTGASRQMELILIPEPGLASLWFNDLAETEQKHWFDQLKPCSLGGVMSPAPAADVEQLKTSCLATSGLYLAMPEAFQKHLAGRVEKNGAEVKIDKVKSGHFVQATHAQQVARWIAEICKS